MEKLQMCRVCLVENVRMYVVDNKSLQKLYEKLTNVPFVTEDSRPMLACTFCCTKLKQCWQFQRKCLKAEELFTQMLNEGYKRDPLTHQGQLQFLSGFIRTPIQNIDIVDVVQIENVVIKQEIPAEFERPDVVEMTEELLRKDIKQENLDDSCSDVEDVPGLLPESHFPNYVPLIEVKIEPAEEHEVPQKEQTAMKTERAPVVPKKSRPDIRKAKLEDSNTEEQFKVKQSDSVIRIIQNHASKAVTEFKETYTDTKLKANKDTRIILNNRVCDNDDLIKRFKCDICPRTFSRKRDIKIHSRTHTGEKPYKCDMCERSFSDKSNYTKHIRVHVDGNAYKCEVCERTFLSRGHLTYHLRTHTGEKPYKCEICQRGFVQKSILTNHLLTHTEEKPFKCDICQRSFRRKCHLTIHITIHSGVKPFKCDICGCRFVRNCSLKKHIRLHVEGKAYKCSVCEGSFSNNYNLKEHMRTHTGDKPYKCEICQRGFAIKRYLKSHIRTHTDKKGRKAYKSTSPVAIGQ